KAELIEDNPVEQPGIEEPQSSGWKVAISATMGGTGTKALAEDPDTRNLIATFETTDNIFVYNKTKKTMDSSPLHPDRDGASVTLTGTLAGSYEEGDELVLCYNSGSTGIFNYKDQEGTLPTVADYAKAEINITAEDVSDKTITGAAAFVNTQSIFGFNFTDGTDRVPVKALEVKTDGNKLVTRYGLWQNYLNPNPYQYYGGITIVADAPLSGAVYVALRNDNEGDDTYHFLVNDGAGHLYSGDKAAPAGKIVNGKFYSSTVALTPVALPSVTITAAGTPVGPNAPWDPTLIDYGWSDLMFGYANYGDLTISGNSNGSWFEWLTFDHSGGDRTVTLDGVTITNPLAETVPLENQDGSFTLVLSGANSITRTAASYGRGIPAISFKGSSICFQGDGTLAVTAATEEAYHCVKGIQGSDSTPNPAAASGYTLTISDGTDNGDGTTTWVYTVRPDVPGLTFDLTAGYPAIAGATKRDWEAGDAVFVFFEGVVAPKYLKMSYDGTGWTCTEMDGDTAAPGCLGLGNGGTGSMRAVFLPFGSNAAVSADGDGFVLDAGTEPFYLTDSRPYTVTSNTLSGNFEMALPEGYVQLYLPDPAADANAVIELREPHFTPQGIASIATDGTITHTRIAHGAPLKGYAYDRGYLFGGILAADARNTPADYRFTLVKGGFAGNYSHTAFSGLTFCTGVAEGRAFNLPSEAGWTPYTDFIPVDLGCDTHLGGQEYKRVYWANRNLGATADTGDGSYGDFFAWGELEPYYEAGYARETPGTHWRAGKEKGFAWASYSGFNPSGDGSTFTKYTGDDFATLQPADDAASQMLGGPWRIPTNTDWRCLYYTLKDEHNDGFVSEEVSDILSWTFSSESVAGYYVTSSAAGCEGNSIFLPLSGRRRDGNLYVYKTGREGGNYWSSSLYSTSEIWDPSSIVYKPDQAYGAAIDRPSDTGQGPLSTGNISRYNGRSVRPVMD
ncbi:MAG: hypothetical protein IJP39_09640, partial [Bacteroidales bacterium]|nr:hypothetical protein [Bacteroidales bacterium]